MLVVTKNTSSTSAFERRRVLYAFTPLFCACAVYVSTRLCKFPRRSQVWYSWGRRSGCLSEETRLPGLRSWIFTSLLAFRNKALSDARVVAVTSPVRRSRLREPQEARRTAPSCVWRADCDLRVMRGNDCGPGCGVLVPDRF